MSKIMHLFILPKSTTNKEMKDFIEKTKKILEEKGVGTIVGRNIEYKELVFDEGEQFSIVRKGDAFEFVKIEKEEK